MPTDHPVFVLHEHQRPQHHFDLRLEENGVLRSWAVPRGMPVSTRDNRLAIEVSDHDLDHATYTDADKVDRRQRLVAGAGPYGAQDGLRAPRPVRVTAVRVDQDVQGLAAAPHPGATHSRRG